MSTRKPILCLDFDGVLHSYSSGWQGADVILDPPVPGAIEFLSEATKHFEVNIFSSRSHQNGGVQAMCKWIAEHLEASGKPDWLSIFDLIVFPGHKPSAMISIDDRTIQFTGVWPSIETLREFKPWNKQ